ncbi:Ankyrin repeats (3 copies) [Mariniflexile rhizosphaerae]|uniref:ankyrin repeat domain-containing protein n=1 Tax=unclassified Mariniflexile TaxID=2643887 RepID=UPI000CAE8FE1|nr:ankyrin repeat domain-containing protein [Mariniflexile sp. TRM1-10]AXP80766.1 Ankyrin repeats (3 copies) [Mariniflexile sp. TRM1-10]PLB19838.1 MAG: Ankyrin repeat protein [Flavobacteriaceae bacterium FS1-H7996/R]
MRKIGIIFLVIILNGCKENLPGFDFESFKNTKAYDLAIAVKNENLGEIERILEKDESLVDYLDPEFGHSLLMLSVANNLQKSVSKLLEFGADPNKKSEPPSNMNNEVTTAVFIASDKAYKRNCETDILELLVKHGGKIDDKIDVKYLNSNYITKETPLMIAIKSDCIDLVKKIVELGADINGYNYINGKGPLANCIVHDNLDILEYLIIERKAEIPSYIFVRPSHNNTPRQELTIIEFLNEQKYPENSKNDLHRKRIINYIENR